MIIAASGQQQACSDGTLYSQCSLTKPKYCSEGILIDDCVNCGCDSGKKCDPATQTCLKGKYKKITIAGTIQTTSGTCTDCEITASFLDATSSATTDSSGNFALTLEPSAEFEAQSYVINGTVNKAGKIYNFRRTIKVE